MRQRRLAFWLVTGLLAAFGWFAGASAASAQEATPAATAAPTASDPAVQGSNSSTDATATGADAAATNVASVGAGPTATGGGAQSSQIGDNSVTVVQRSEARSGDAVAGSQVVGVVGGNATIQGQNSSTGATATSGAATAVNTALVNAGPSASATGTGTAGAQQIGDNSVEVVQESVAESGSAVAGSQVTGLIGSSSGDAVVQNQNDSADALAIGGAASAINTALVSGGPSSTSEDGDADVQQIGDNDAVLTQLAEATSGDVVAGGQVTGGIVGGATVQGQNSSTSPVATGAPATAVNTAFFTAGPSALTTGTGSAQVAQNGDNSVDADQQALASSGDAVAGSQVSGLVGEERGHLTVQNQQSSEDPVATSGSATAVNTLVANAGPTGSGDGLAEVGQIGDNDVDATQLAEATTGDAVAGSQVAGGVGGDATVQTQNNATSPVAESGPAAAVNTGVVNAGPAGSAGVDGDALVSQIGDNDADLDQETVATSGDAVAGSTVIGVVSDGDDVTIQAQNSSEDAIATSGPAAAVATAILQSGPSADASGTGTATASQIGDSSIGLDQETTATSGDAVAGSIVVGAVGSDDSVVQLQNDSTADTATTLDATAIATAVGNTGPLASTGGTASQIGDNDIDADQDTDAESGDAVAGSQVVGTA